MELQRAFEIDPIRGEVVLSVADLRVCLGGVWIFPNLSFELRRGETLVILGPNGAGKTVLLRALLGLLPHQGSVKWKSGARLGYVPQRVGQSKDLPLTVDDFFSLKRNVCLAPREALGRVGIADEGFMRKQLGDLSSGQFQRVLIAWSLIGKPDVILFDEPTSGIDIGGDETIHDLLTRMKKEEALSILLVTHDLSTVYAEADHVLCMNNRTFCYGTPQEVLEPGALRRIYGREIQHFRHMHGGPSHS